jgi:hypothetical protein
VGEIIQELEDKGKEGIKIIEIKPLWGSGFTIRCSMQI